MVQGEILLDLNRVFYHYSKRHPDRKPLTAKKLAKKIGKHPMTVGKWKRNPSLTAKDLYLICDIIGVWDIREIMVVCGTKEYFLNGSM